jgi:hypothetical protein
LRKRGREKEREGETKRGKGEEREGERGGKKRIHWHAAAFPERQKGRYLLHLRKKSRQAISEASLRSIVNGYQNGIKETTCAL